MSESVVSLCNAFMKYRDVISDLYRIVGDVLPEVMIYSTVAVLIDRLGTSRTLDVMMSNFKQFDPLKLAEFRKDYLTERYIAKALMRAVRSEVNRIIAEAMMNALKNVRGVDVREVIKRTSEELNRILELDQIKT